MRFSGVGLAAGINPIDRCLRQPIPQPIRQFENGRAHQHFQRRLRFPRRLGLEPGHQRLDFFVLGQEDGGRDWCILSDQGLEPLVMASVPVCSAE